MDTFTPLSITIWSVGAFEGWCVWKVGKLKGWSGGVLEGWKVGMLKGWSGGVLEGWKVVVVTVSKRDNHFLPLEGDTMWQVIKWLFKLAFLPLTETKDGMKVMKQ